jgi:hypothetical protein
VRTVIALLALLMIGVGGIKTQSALSQNDVRWTLIGVWEGTVTRGGDTAPTRLEFVEKDGEVLWTWSWQATFGTGQAEGTVTKYAPPAIELSGRYTLHPLPSVRNSPTTLSLTVTETWMQGRGRIEAWHTHGGRWRCTAPGFLDTRGGYQGSAPHADRRS